MPTLDWIGKKAVLNHHNEVPYRLLRCNKELSVGDPGSGNLLVQGDNLEALKALLPYYAGKVKCIYIDPPYNTGVDERDEEGKRTGWTYSDNVDSPEIRDWLNRVVGPEAEDLSRHDKWLCMMRPRLAILRQFLREDGVLLASIDEIEYGNLRALLDEIFGVPQRVGTIVWKNATDNNPTNITVEHEYVLCYARNRQKLQPEWKAATLTAKAALLKVSDDFVRRHTDQDKRQAAYTKWYREHRWELWPFQDYKFIDGGGVYTGMRAVHNPGKEGYRYDVPHPVTGLPCKQPMMGYRFPEETMRQLLAENRILFGDDETKIVELKVYAKDYRAKLSSLYELDGRAGTNELKDIFPDSKRPFDFPKPVELIEDLLSYTTTGEDLILDSFAGTATTGHAVMTLNRADGQARRFVLVEMKPSIAKEIAAERLRRVIGGYASRSGDSVPGLGGGFRYCEMGPTLFDANGGIRHEVSFRELAQHVYFTETGEPLPTSKNGKTPLLGVHNETAVYLLYNGVLQDKKPDGGNVLTRSVLEGLPAHAGAKVVYGTACRISPRALKVARVSFRQIPYEVRTR
jgi:adenine-specific DNA-methyltransferase